MSHNFAVMSDDVEASREPDGENTTHVTDPVCPFNVRSYCAVSKSHSLMVLSSEAEAVRLHDNVIYM